MDMYGYAGKILYVDLTTGVVRKEPLDKEFARKWIGDFGIDVRLAYDLIKTGMDPLAPESPIIIGAGPLVGTAAPSSGRVTAITKNPLAGNIGSSGGSMGFSCQLKYAGYDNLVITGAAGKPVYLNIFDDAVEICDATTLWGKDLFQTTDELYARHGRGSSVVAIGPASENLVKIGITMVDKSGSFGYGGLATVMGSKKLKAIVARGTNSVKIADRLRFMKVTNRVLNGIRKWPNYEKYIDMGHAMCDYLPLLRMTGTTNNRTEFADWGDVMERLGPKAYTRVKWRRVACPSCTAGCRDILKIRRGPFKGLTVDSQGLMPTSGVPLGMENIENFTRMYYECQRYGLSDRDFMSVVQLARQLYDEGIITSDDTEGVTFEGGFDNTMRLIQMITFREGIGDVLADGYAGIFKRFGKESEKYAIQFKGAAGLPLEIRAIKLGPMAFDFLTNPMTTIPKGGMLNPGKFDPGASRQAFAGWGEQMHIPKAAMDRVLDSPFIVNHGRLTRYTQDIYSVFCCLGVCMRLHIAQRYSMSDLAELYSAATGIELSPTELIEAGERAWNMGKALNVREGFSRKDDEPPARWFEPIKISDENLSMMSWLKPLPTKGEIRLMDQFETKVLTPEDIDMFLDDYYDERGWSKESGLPTTKKLIELGLKDVAEDLKKAGFINS